MSLQGTCAGDMEAVDRMEIDGTLVISGVSWLGSAGVGGHWGGGRDSIVNQQVEVVW